MNKMPIFGLSNNLTITLGAILQFYIDCEYSELLDRSMILVPLEQNRLVTRLKHEDFEILIESEGRLLTRLLVDG